jgi:hypothetical protein
MSSSRASTTLLAALALVTTGACGASQGSGGTTPGGDTRPAHVDGPPAGASNDNGPVTAEAQGLGAVDPSLVFGGGGDPSQLGGAAGAARDTEGQVLVPGPHFSPPVPSRRAASRVGPSRDTAGRWPAPVTIRRAPSTC